MPSLLSRLYLKSELPKGVAALYSNRIIQQIAGGLLSLFLPVFLFERFQSISLVLIWFLIGHLLYIFLGPAGAIIATKISFNKALMISVLGGVFYYICLYFFDYNLWLLAGLAILGLSFDRMFYWVPYHSGFAKFTDKGNRGRTYAFLTSVVSLLSIFLPLIAGFLISGFGFSFLFLVVVLVYSSSVIPFFFIPQINEYYTFGYWQTFKILFHKRDRRILLTYMADGAENLIGVVIWPIFIWQLLSNDYVAVGVVSSLIVLATVVLRLLMGQFTDSFNKKKLLRYGTLLYSIGWFFKIFVQTGFHIFLASAFHNFSNIAMRTPYDTLMYEKAADAGHYVDEYSVLREISINLGRVLMILLVLALINYVDLNYTFLFAAVASLFINLI